MTRDIGHPETGPVYATADEAALCASAGFAPDRLLDGHPYWVEDFSESAMLAILRAAYAAGRADAQAMPVTPTTRSAAVADPSSAPVIDPTPVVEPVEPDQAFLASGLADYSPLKLHLASRHALCNALNITDAEAHNIHEHEHDGPGTIRNHPREDRSWVSTAVIDVLLEGIEMDGTTIEEALPHLQPLIGGLSMVCAGADKPVMHGDCVHPHCACPHHTQSPEG